LRYTEVNTGGEAGDCGVADTSEGVAPMKGPAVSDRRRTLVAVLAAALTLASIHGGRLTAQTPGSPAPAAPSPAKPLVVASIYPLYDFARNVASDRAEVVVLVPAGVEPHDWEPSPRDLVQLQRARLFVYNGAGLEPWVDKLSHDIRRGGVVAVNATEGFPLLEARKGGHDHHEPKYASGKSKGRAAALDPHVWLDPTLAKGQVERIRDGLARVDPANAAHYAESAGAYASRLDALDLAFKAGLRDCARRDVVVSHAAFAYLTGRYRLSMLPVMGLAPESEPSPAELAGLVRLARRRQVKYILFETLVNAKLAETLAREVGAKTLVLNPVEGLTREQAAAGASYLSLMEENLKNLRTALDCR
jgi:zinc transport system substrate-binding protein